jgi:hypothetical protein
MPSLHKHPMNGTVRRTLRLTSIHSCSQNAAQSHCEIADDSLWGEGTLLSRVHEFMSGTLRRPRRAPHVLSLLVVAVTTSTSAPAQTPTSTVRMTHASAAAPADDSSWKGPSNLNAQLSAGTQPQNPVSLFATTFHGRGRTPDELLVNSRVRFDVGYGNAQKPGQDRITTTEMLYGETRVSADATQWRSAFDGSISPRETTAASGSWIDDIAAWYHHIAFDLSLQQAHGAGVARDGIGGIPGLAESPTQPRLPAHLAGHAWSRSQRGGRRCALGRQGDLQTHEGSIVGGPC